MANPSVTAGDLTFTEGQSPAPAIIDGDATVSDGDGSDQTKTGKLTVRITNNAKSADRLAINTSPGDHAIANDGTLTLDGTDIGTVSETSGSTDNDGVVTSGDTLTVNLNDNATVSRVQALARAVTYNNTTQDPDTSDRTVTLTVTDKNDDSGSDTSTVQVNALPSITVDDLTFTENGSPAPIDDGASVADNAVANGSLSAQITGNAQSADRLAIDTSGNFAVNSGTLSLSGTDIGTVSETSGMTDNDGVVTNGDKLTVNLNGNATASNVQKLARAITYETTSDTPNTSDRTVTFDLADGNGGIATTTAAIGVNAANDAPTLGGGPLTPPRIEQNTSDPGGQTVNKLLDEAGSLADPEVSKTDAIGVAVTGLTENTDHGAWQYATDGGSTWRAFGDVTTLSDSSAVLLAPDDKLRFVPKKGVTSAPADEFLTVKAWDRSVGKAGATTADTSNNGTNNTFSSGTVDVKIDVTDTTAPTLASAAPADESVVHPPAADLKVTFDEKIDFGSGTIDLIAPGEPDSVSESFDVGTDTDGTDPGDGKVGIDGDTLIINPNNDLLAGTRWVVQIDSGALTDEDTAASTNDFAGIDDNETLNFTTAGSAPAFAGDPKDTGSLDTITSVTEDGGAQDISSALAVVDADNGEDLSFTVADQPDHGTLALDFGTTNGGEQQPATATYEPDGDFDGTDSVKLSIAPTDGTGGSDTVTVDIDVQAQGDAPSTSDSTRTIDEDSTVSLAAGDVPFSDPDTGDGLKDVTISAPPNTGTLFLDGKNGNPTNDQKEKGEAVAGGDTISASAVNADNLLYAPPADRNGKGLTTIDFTVTDQDGNTSGAGTLTIDVTPKPDAPAAKNDTGTVAELGGMTTVSVLKNDGDGDGDNLSVSVISSPGNGSTSVQNGGAIAYTASDGFAGTDSFTYEVRDGTGRTDTATVSVDVVAGNAAPTAKDDSFDILPGASSPTLDVLGNDSDPDGAAGDLSVGFKTTPDTASVTVENDGTIRFEPDDGFNKEATFTYIVTDPEGASDTGKVTVAPVDAPAVSDDTFKVDPNTGTKDLKILDNDGAAGTDGLKLTITDPPANATAKLQDDNTVAFTPDDGFAGTTDFTYEVTNAAGAPATATATVTVREAPDVGDDSFKVAEQRGEKALDILANDGSAGDDGIAVKLQDAPDKGKAALNDDKTVAYTPPDDFAGTTTFTYGITNANGVTSTAEVTVKVTDDPVSLTALPDDELTVKEDTRTTLDVLKNDLIPEGTDTTLTLASTPDGGGVSVTKDNKIAFDPDADFTGKTTFDYTLRGGGAHDDATATVDVVPVNSPPEAVADTVRITNAGERALDVLTNDSDPDGDALDLAITKSPSNGSVRITEDALAYTPDDGFTGTDSLTYAAVDEAGATATATAEITVAPARHLVLPDGTAQTVSIGFPAEIRSTAAAEGVRLRDGTELDMTAGKSDVLRLPGALSDFQVAASGNRITLSDDNGTRADIALNADVSLVFDDGTATAGIQPGPEGINIRLGGAVVNDGVDPAKVSLSQDGPALPGDDGAGGVLMALSGQDATVRVPFTADVRGTSAAETVEVPPGGDATIAAGAGDRVAFGKTASAYQFQASGNKLTVSREKGARADVSINGKVELAFADGGTSAEIGPAGGGLAVRIGGVPVDDAFDPASVQLDAGDASALASDLTDTKDGGNSDSGGDQPAMNAVFPADDGLMLA